MRLLLCLGLLLSSFAAASEENVTLPWEEFKTLYRDQLQREFAEQHPTAEKPFLYSIDAVSHSVTVQGSQVQARMLIRGQVISGQPQAIDLFQSAAVLSAAESVNGGTLLYADKRYQFLPKKRRFQLDLQFLHALEEDSESEFVRLPVPEALRNQLQIHLADGYQLLNPPGLADAQDNYYFSPRQELTLRFASQQQLAQAKPIEISGLHLIEMQGEQAMLSSYYFSHQALSQTLDIPMPAGARFLSTSLKPSDVSQDAQKVSIRVGGISPQQLFTLQYTLAPQSSGAYQFALPAIADNTERSNYLLVQEIDGGQVKLTDQYPQISAARLDANLQNIAQNHAGSLFEIPSSSQVALNYQRFAGVGTPEVVLDGMYFYAAFEESGSMLAVLKMTLPAAAGPRLQLQKVPGAKIWSLQVNGEKKQVYALDESSWIIPLAQGRVSEVELAYLLESDKLGLQGRLEAQIPATHLPTRRVFVGVALPPRVDLISLEADLSQAKGEGWELPSSFIGKPYFFSRAFYTGAGMPVALFYKEPVQFKANSGDAQ